MNMGFPVHEMNKDSEDRHDDLERGKARGLKTAQRAIGN